MKYVCKREGCWNLTSEVLCPKHRRAEFVLNAALDCLAENADEWWLQAFQPERRDGKVTDGLLTTLREDR